MIHALRRGSVPEPELLRRRFDFAVTKKLGVLRLPPPFWSDDPKINPRSDHLFWAALLLRDREKILLALSVLETEETMRKQGGGAPEFTSGKRSCELVRRLLALLEDKGSGETLEQDLRGLIPECFGEAK
ncbi:MAG: hypothetical protein Kow0089_08990 [Desulfobulbaceae bacterium]